MKRQTAMAACVLLAIWASGAAHAASAATFSRVVCAEKVDDDDATAIVASVFNDKFASLAAAYDKAAIRSPTLTPAFFKRNEGLAFATCNNEGSFDSTSIYGTGVVFDLKLIALLLAQSRALILGASVSAERPFALHETLIRAFISEGSERSINPLAQVKNDFIAAGMTQSQYTDLLNDPTTSARVQNLFLAALNFLSLHERCHFGLDHGSKVAAILKISEASRPPLRHLLELDADRCAQSIINADEAQFAYSPIAYFGLSMVVTTQVIASAFAASPATSSHPSGLTRLDAAEAEALRYLDDQSGPAVDTYRYTIRAFGNHMEEMAAAADQRRNNARPGATLTPQRPLLRPQGRSNAP